MAGIINDAIVGPFAVPDGVKMNAQSYVEFSIVRRILPKEFPPLVQEVAIGPKEEHDIYA